MNAQSTTYSQEPSPPPFKFGDWGDATLGTVLRVRGCTDPAALLFATLDFSIDPEPFGDVATVFGYRDDWTLGRRLNDWLGASVIEHRFRDRADFVAALKDLARSGATPIVQIDHFGYGPSHLNGHGHLPHRLVVMHAISDDEFLCVDPFPAFDKTSATSIEELAKWASPDGLPGGAFTLFEVVSARRLAFDAGAFRREAGEDVLSDNRRRMRLAEATLERLAEVLADWIAQDGPLRGSAPLVGLYDIGAVRLCHADWLSALAAVDRHPELESAAELLRESGRRWNVFNSLRAMHDRLSEATDESRRFIVQKVRTYPEMIRRIAGLEAAATARLQQIVGANER
jgi:hypothetical protein